MFFEHRHDHFKLNEFHLLIFSMIYLKCGVKWQIEKRTLRVRAERRRFDEQLGTVNDFFQFSLLLITKIE